MTLRFLLLASTLSLAVAMPAIAADHPPPQAPNLVVPPLPGKGAGTFNQGFLKAPVYAPACTISNCTGWFIGATISQAGGSFNLLNTGLDGLAQNGVGLGGQSGWEFWNGQVYAAAYVRGSWNAVQNSSVLGVGNAISNRGTWGGGVRLGYSLAQIFGFNATNNTVTAPTLPQQLAASFMTPYIGVEEVSRRGQAAIDGLVGIEALVAANWTLNAEIRNYDYNQGGTSGTLAGVPVKQTTEQEAAISINYHLPWGR